MNHEPAHLRYEAKPFYGSSHWWAFQQIAHLPPGRAIDIGPGSGVIGEELKRLGWTTIDCVEPDSPTRERLHSVYGQCAPGLDALADRQYDLVILLDVLEHMTDPEAFLMSLRPFLAAQSMVLVSVPNIAHWSVRLPLLFGFFTYTRRGILDRTHYHFFTRQSFHALLATLPRASIVASSASIEPIELLLPAFVPKLGLWRLLSRIRQSVATFFPGLLAYQHLALVRTSAP